VDLVVIVTEIDRVNAFQSTVSNVSFSYLNPELQSAITDAYRGFDRANSIAESFSLPSLKSFAGTSPETFREIRGVVDAVSDGQSEQLRRSLSNTIKLLEDELSLLKKK